MYNVALKCFEARKALRVTTAKEEEEKKKHSTQFLCKPRDN